MLGDNLLVASVVEKGKKQRDVYLPQHDGGWYDFHEGTWFEGGQTVTIPAPLHYVPLLVKGGSILPVNLADVSFADKHKDERGFLLFPEKGSSESVYRLYEDDGVTAQYKEDFAYVAVKMNTTETEIHINAEIEGNFTLPYDTAAFILPQGEKES
ncbi:DUF5110 domain-containing protein [Bacillus sp. OVS6]|nr:DUF5110 domain-containing protein [Bacillus sp. OVS6]